MPLSYRQGLPSDVTAMVTSLLGTPSTRMLTGTAQPVGELAGTVAFTW
jgi:hypothetical protein